MPCYISVPQLKRICSVPVLCDEYQQAEFSLELNTRLTLSFSQALPFPTGALSSSAFSSSSPPILCSIFPVPYLILHRAYKGARTHTHSVSLYCTMPAGCRLCGNDIISSGPCCCAINIHSRTQCRISKSFLMNNA